MKSSGVGTGTSAVEVVNISRHGVWLYVKGAEYFLPYDDFPWFREARVGVIQDVHLLHGHHLHWKRLDVDLDVSSLEQIERYPLRYR